MISGPGAGGKPTASAVLADIVDCANNTKFNSFGRPANKLKSNFKTVPYTEKYKFYLRLNVIDKSGVLADLTSIFKSNNLSIESFIQKSNQKDKTADLIIITHEAENNILKKALNKIIELDGVISEPLCLSIYS
jgi:homoserine dehydrogenase